MRTLFLAPALLGMLSPFACGGIVAPGDATPAPSSSSHSTPPGTAPTATAPPGSPTATPPTGSSTAPASVDPSLAKCTSPEGTSQVTFTSQSDALAHLAKVWRACPSAAQAYGSIGGPAGFEIGADGSYYALDEDASGNLLRMTGFTNEGQFVYQ